MLNRPEETANTIRDGWLYTGLVLSSLPYQAGFIISAILAIIVTIFFEYLFPAHHNQNDSAK